MIYCQNQKTKILLLIFFLPLFILTACSSKKPAVTDSAGQSSGANAPSFDLSKLVLPEEVELPDQTIPLTWSDDNTNENLIIKSDRKYYDGSGQTEVYFSITNATSEEQKTDIVFWFDNADKQLARAEKIENGKISNYSNYSSYSKQTPNPNDRNIGNSDIGGSLGQLEIRLIRNSYRDSYHEKLKDIRGYTDGNAFADNIPANQTNFYKVVISYPKDQKQSEFFIEAFGLPKSKIRNQKSEIAYGHLDPYLAGGLVGHWTFNGPDMDWKTNTAYDRSGQGNNGKVMNMSTTTSPVFGHSGQALKFDGVDDYTDIQDNAVFNLAVSGNYTWSFWINLYDLTPLNDWNVLWAQEIDPNNYFYIYVGSYDDNQWGPVTDGIALSWVSYDGVLGWRWIAAETTNNVFAAKSWYHVVASYDGSQSELDRFKIYINAVDKTSGPEAAGTIADINSNYIRVGGNQSFGEYFYGQVDEVRFYNRTLSASEILALYKAEGGR